MSHDESLNPLIVGPRSSFISQTPSQELALDLNETSPLQDLICLFRYPKRFFLIFRSGPNGYTGWLWGKAIVGALLAFWISEFISNGHYFSANAGHWIKDVDPRIFLYIESKLHIAHAQIKLATLLTVLAQFKVIIAPFLEISGILLWAAGVCIGLNFLDVPWNKIFFQRLLLMSLYLKWFYFLAFIPVVGTTLGLFASIGMGIFAIKWLFDLSFGRALIAVYLVRYLVIISILIFASVPLFVLSAIRL